MSPEETRGLWRILECYLESILSLVYIVNCGKCWGGNCGFFLVYTDEE